jgi:hypothetical protein
MVRPGKAVTVRQRAAHGPPFLRPRPATGRGLLTGRGGEAASVRIRARGKGLAATQGTARTAHGAARASRSCPRPTCGHSSLRGRDGGPPSAAWQATVWWGIRSLFVYLEDKEDVPDIARKITVGRPAVSDRISHLDPHEVSALLDACPRPAGAGRDSASPWTPGSGSPSWPACR